MGEAVHGPAIDDEQPVGAGVVHLVDEADDLLDRDVRIERTVTDEELGLDAARLDRSRCGEASMDAGRTGGVRATSRQLKHGQAPEAVADRNKLPVDPRMGGKPSRPARARCTSFAGSSRSAVTVDMTRSRSPIPPCRTGRTQRDQPEFGELPRAAPAAVVETRAALNHQHPRALGIETFIPDEQPGELCVPIAVADALVPTVTLF